SSSSSSAAGLAGVLALALAGAAVLASALGLAAAAAGFLAGGAFLGFSSSISSRSSTTSSSSAGAAFLPPLMADVFGSSTTKRYLHLGQSIFLPMRLGSLTSTPASHEGQGVLKLPVVAMMCHLRERPN